MLRSGEPCSQLKHGRAQADWHAVTAANHGSETATSPIVASVQEGRRGHCGERGGERHYTAAAAVKENIVALVSSESCSRVEKEGEEEEEEEEEGRQAESHCAQEELQKCNEEADCMATVVARKETERQLKDGIATMVARAKYSEAARWQTRLKRFQEENGDRKIACLAQGHTNGGERLRG